MLVAHFSKSTDRSIRASFKRPRITIDKKCRKDGKATRLELQKKKKPKNRERKKELACVLFSKQCSDKNKRTCCSISAMADTLLNVHFYGQCKNYTKEIRETQRNTQFSTMQLERL